MSSDDAGVMILGKAMRIGVWGGGFVRRTIALAADVLGDVAEATWLPDDSNPLADDAFDLLVIGTDMLVSKAHAGEGESGTAPSYGRCLQAWSDRLRAYGAVAGRPPVLLINFAISADAAPGLRYLGMDLASDVPNVFSASPLPLLTYDAASRPDARQARQMLNQALRRGLAAVLRARLEPAPTDAAEQEERERRRLLNQFPPAMLAEPLISISFMQGEPECNPSCRVEVDKLKEKLQSYFAYEDLSIPRDRSPNTVCAVIDLNAYENYAAFHARLKKSGGGARVRHAKRAVNAGIFCEPFERKLFVPDLHAIFTSKETRNGRPMSAAYRKTVEEMGGYPQRMLPLRMPNCPWHWSFHFGAFMPAPGHKQGEVVVDKRLVAYIMLVRRGEYLAYSEILGHGDVLDTGAMSLLHHEAMRWIMDPENPYTRRLRLVLYAGADQGGPGLRDWKKREMFTRARVMIARQPAHN